MPQVREDWLALTKEEALEPELPICDPHHHLWDYPGSRYMLEELVADIAGGHNVVCTVFVECMSMYNADAPPHLRPVGETEFVQGIAAQSASGRYGKTRVAQGIVGFADLTRGAAVDEVLEAHLQASPNRFRGIRHASGWDPSDEVRNSHTSPPQGLLADRTFREGFARLASHGLSYESWLYHPQIPELTELARAFPETVIVFDHLGGPLGIGPYAGRREEVFERWKRDVSELAKCDNVVCKVGGMQMPINGFAFHKQASPPSSDALVEHTGPYYRYVIEAFGPKRCMFESNFPVDKVSCSYTVLWNAFKKLTSDLSASERAQLFHDTAARVYRLQSSTGSQ